jgi:hypothetical protein
VNERRVLQVCVGIAACLPVAGGLHDVLSGLAGHSRMTAGMAIVSYATESHYRYLSGLLVALGVAFWSTLPEIEQRAPRFRLLTAIVVGGGLARLLGVLLGDKVTFVVAIALVMELAVTPLLCLWQARVVQLARSGPNSATAD